MVNRRLEAFSSGTSFHHKLKKVLSGGFWNAWLWNYIPLQKMGEICVLKETCRVPEWCSSSFLPVTSSFCCGGKKC